MNKLVESWAYRYSRLSGAVIFTIGALDKLPENNQQELKTKIEAIRQFLDRVLHETDGTEPQRGKSA